MPSYAVSIEKDDFLSSCKKITDGVYTFKHVEVSGMYKSSKTFIDAEEAINLIKAMDWKNPNIYQNPPKGLPSKAQGSYMYLVPRSVFLKDYPVETDLMAPWEEIQETSDGEKKPKSVWKVIKHRSVNFPEVKRMMIFFSYNENKPSSSVFFQYVVDEISPNNKSEAEKKHDFFKYSEQISENTMVFKNFEYPVIYQKFTNYLMKEEADHLLTREAFYINQFPFRLPVALDGTYTFIVDKKYFESGDKMNNRAWANPWREESTWQKFDQGNGTFAVIVNSQHHRANMSRRAVFYTNKNRKMISAMIVQYIIRESTAPLVKEVVLPLLEDKLPLKPRSEPKIVQTNISNSSTARKDCKQKPHSAAQKKNRASEEEKPFKTSKRQSNFVDLESEIEVDTLLSLKPHSEQKIGKKIVHNNKTVGKRGEQKPFSPAGKSNSSDEEKTFGTMKKQNYSKVFETYFCNSNKVRNSDQKPFSSVEKKRKSSEEEKPFRTIKTRSSLMELESEERFKALKSHSEPKIFEMNVYKDNNEQKPFSSAQKMHKSSEEEKPFKSLRSQSEEKVFQKNKSEEEKPFRTIKTKINLDELEPQQQNKTLKSELETKVFQVTCNKNNNLKKDCEQKPFSPAQKKIRLLEERNSSRTMKKINNVIELESEDRFKTWFKPYDSDELQAADHGIKELKKLRKELIILGNKLLSAAEKDRIHIKKTINLKVHRVTVLMTSLNELLPKKPPLPPKVKRTIEIEVIELDDSDDE